ncbi:N-6 DNA methylase [Microcystis aeruginosa]|jgi:type I restriction enzyme M protein|uniref:N-6 DNA methylase n=1 Tax=Microcystis aeruginosa TaxID=1126 RepID=UPI000468FCF0|nr:N-6 DNA methylase [Microcystis aeruginosa]MDB9394445.1 N-6 DNA methylase [Microcystis aeruginosa CS-573]
MSDLKAGYIVDFISGEQVKSTPEEIGAVQIFARQLVEDYGYPKEHIQTRPQFRVKARPSDTKKEYPVDIAIFPNEKKQEDDVYIIVECKKKNRKDGKTQLQDYLRFSKAFLGVWFNGEERFFLRKVEKSGRIEFEEIPNIPQYGQRVEDIGKFKRKDLKPTHNLKSTFKAIRNHLAANTVGATRDEILAQQLINMIFCKIYDERFTEPNDVVTFRAGVDENSNDIKERILELFNRVKRKYKEVLDDSDAITLDANSVSYVVGELQNYCLIEAERDIIADAFETFIGHALKGGQGQFFTPRNVVKMMVDILDPDDEDIIIDPACGSGGFLIEALRHVWRKLDAEGEKYHWNKSNLQEEKMEVALNRIRGIDKDYFLSKVAKAYMAIIGDGKSGIFCEDSLERPENWQDKTKLKIDMGKFSVLLTNPPFGSKIPVRGEDKLKQFEFGYKWKFDKDTKKWWKTEELKEQEEPQVLFIERCLSLLKDGGRMAMVLPNGILGNEQESYLRQYIQDKGDLFAIVELPFETFSPNVTINTSVLFIQKGKSDKKDIFVSINENCGHDKKGRPTDKDDIIKVSSFYSQQIKQDENNFFIKRTDIENNFVAKRYLQKFITNLENISKSQYPIVDFGQIISSVHNGANIKDSSIYVEKQEGIPYILVKSITKEGINFENLKFIKKSLKTNKDVIKNMVSENSIVMTRAGNSGIAANIPPDLIGGVASGFLINIKIKDEVNPYYIVAYLNSNYGQMQLERISSGSILESIRSSDLKQVKIILPPKEIQNTIGDKVKESVINAAKIRELLNSADTDVDELAK